MSSLLWFVFECAKCVYLNPVFPSEKVLPQATSKEKQVWPSSLGSGLNFDENLEPGNLLCTPVDFGAGVGSEHGVRPLEVTEKGWGKSLPCKEHHHSCLRVFVMFSLLLEYEVARAQVYSSRFSSKRLPRFLPKRNFSPCPKKFCSVLYFSDSPSIYFACHVTSP